MSHLVPTHPEILTCEEGPSRFGKIPASLMLAAALLPVIVWFVKRLNDGSDEPLGLLPLSLALLLAWRDRHSLAADAKSRTLGALAVFISVASIGTLPPLLRAALGIAGAGAWFGLLRRPGLLGLLILSLPVVASLQFYLGYPLRLAAAMGAVRLLELGGIVVSASGVNVSIGGMDIAVDPACSGIRMLWHALAAAMALAAIHRVSWRGTLAGGLLAFLLVIPANVLRAAWLALEESGRAHGSGISHGGIGLVCFCMVLALLCFMMSRKARPRHAPETSSAPRAMDRIILMSAALLAPLLMMRNLEPAPPFHAAPPPADFTFNGLTLPLVPQPHSPEEVAFARSFPGSLSSHMWGDGQVILRRVTTATRKLHPSRDCLRAAGYQTTDSVTVRGVDRQAWSRFTATREGNRFIVHERIVSEQDGSSWTDVTAWYWSALRHPLNGPWRAETVISR
jgi:exosortase/archaeosortase family protein